MLDYLWKHREAPALFSRRWLIVWVKRALTAPSLAALLRRRAWLRLCGADVAGVAVIEHCHMVGPARRLSLGSMSFIGVGTRLTLHDRIVVGERVVINSGVTILTASHDLHDSGWRTYSREVVIGDYAWIATGAMLLPGVRIGRGAVVGAGAVVRRDVPDHGVVSGNPAVPAGTRRCERLAYNPAALAAPLEAWLGKPPQSCGPV